MRNLTVDEQNQDMFIQNPDNFFLKFKRGRGVLPTFPLLVASLNLYSEFKARALTPLEGSNDGCKTNKHTHPTVLMTVS